MLINRKAQSTLEYSVLIALIVAGLLAMQVYLKRGVQGRLRQSADEIGEQFSPGFTTVSRTTTSSITSSETITGGDRPTSVTRSVQEQAQESREDVGKFEDELWK